MAKFIGQQFNIGIGKESSRGTAVTATYWLPNTSLSIDDKIKTAKDENSIGVIEDGVGQEITNRYSEATIEGRATDLGFGLILMSLMGTDTLGSVETGVKDHAFTVAQSAQHPALSLSVTEPNAGSGVVYPLGMLDQLDINIELDKYITYKAVYKANKNQSQSNTTGYTSENAFRPQDFTFGYASTLSGLSSPTAVSIKKASLSFKKNTEDDEVLGSIDPADRLNKQFSVSGSFELFYTDRTMIDTIMIGDLYKALQFKALNSGVTIGTTSHPTLTVNLARTKLTEVSRKIDDKGIVSQTVKFTGFYSLGDTSMVNITLRNTVTAAY